MDIPTELWTNHYFYSCESGSPRNLRVILKNSKKTKTKTKCLLLIFEHFRHLRHLTVSRTGPLPSTFTVHYWSGRLGSGFSTLWTYHWNDDHWGRETVDLSEEKETQSTQVLPSTFNSLHIIFNSFNIQFSAYNL